MICETVLNIRYFYSCLHVHFCVFNYLPSQNLLLTLELLSFLYDPLHDCVVGNWESAGE